MRPSRMQLIWAYGRQPDSLHQTGFALAAELESPRNMFFFLGCTNKQPKKYILLGGSKKPPRKHAIFLAVQLCRQVNMQFS